MPLENESLAAPDTQQPGILFGDDGLRAGWSILVFTVINVLLSVLVSAVLLHVHLLAHPAKPGAATELTARGTELQDGLGFLQLALAAWVMTRVERRPFRSYGTPSHRMLPDFGLGIFWGFILLSGLIALLFFTHHIAFEGLAERGTQAVIHAGAWAVAFLCVGLFEEFLFRGYLQFTLARGIAGIARALRVSSPHTGAIGFWGAAFLLSGIFFAGTHLGNGGETASGIAAVALAGAVFAFSLWRTASLWWAIGFHTAWDWAQTFFYGTPDSGMRGLGHLFNTHPLGTVSLSGGSDGPEGSLFVIPTLLAALLVIHLTLPYRPRPLTPDRIEQKLGSS